jgi:hypothetical protein
MRTILGVDRPIDDPHSSNPDPLPYFEGTDHSFAHAFRFPALQLHVAAFTRTQLIFLKSFPNSRALARAATIAVTRDS